jgi:hypothetical protein
MGVMSSPYYFPITTVQDSWSITSYPATAGTGLKHTTITETHFPQGNSTRHVETYSVIVYDAAGRLDAYNHRSNYIDIYI